MEKFNELIDEIIDKHPDYENFISDYFIKNKKTYFEDSSYNYQIIPYECRSNSALENYNKYLKNNLGKKITYVGLIL